MKNGGRSHWSFASFTAGCQQLNFPYRFAVLVFLRVLRVLQWFRLLFQSCEDAVTDRFHRADTRDFYVSRSANRTASGPIRIIGDERLGL